MKISFKCKNRVGNTRLSPHAKMLLQMSFSLTGRLCSGGKRFAAYSILRGLDTHIDFLQLCVVLHLNKGFRLFNFLQSASWIRITISDFLLARECDGFLRCFVTR